MKVYISADIEGIAGICNWKETEHGDDYEYFRAQMTKEVKACCEALIECGITDITVRDAHDSARNILIEQLPTCVKIIREWSGGVCDMMDAIDESYDAAILIGYHSPARSNRNPLSHTQNTSRHVDIKINDKIMSEYHLNTYFAQHHNVPVIMLCGDQGLCEIAKSENSLITTVATKEGLGGSVISKHPSVVVDEIKAKTIEAIKLFKKHSKKDFFIPLDENIDFQIHFRSHIRAYRASFYPNAEMINSDIVSYKTNNIVSALAFMLFCD